ncbi:uncharacterized protein LOC124934410 [Impatiens glandulifera]|uniref:uncharacterized protein LOC124934410 n=1 Tax=Impatiens glandulifera TaxID=253017 RepID=UPI001FB0C3C4|nr:uncharacterized protein LOC124934410 [Impatiens glandulifera]
MNLAEVISGSLKEEDMTIDTTDPSYWLNWRFLLCALFILTSMVLSALIIWRYEGATKSKTRKAASEGVTLGTVYSHEAWMTCLRTIHPSWLMGYRVIAFSVLLVFLIVNIVLDGGVIVFFYTQWTFAVVTLYFGMASAFSIHGCLKHKKMVFGDMHNDVDVVANESNYAPPRVEENFNLTSMTETPIKHDELYLSKTANICGYIFQVVYQTCGGAVILTDSVFWFILFPFFTPNHQLGFLDVSMHSLNAIFLLGDVLLNGMRFPFFRVTYFILWTCIFVVFQWIVHACHSMWWPYPFLDISSPYSPLWYVAVGVLHLPCYGIFYLIARMKNRFIRRSFPDSFQCTTR